MPYRGYNPCSYLPRRLQIVFSLTVFILVTIVFFGSSSDRASHYRDELRQGAERAADYIPENIHRQFSESSFNPFRAPAHKPPPEQANSTSGDISWLGDWKWKNPFSSSIAYDDRAVLPPEESRTPIYTYYDGDTKKEADERQAEHDLLLAWRRAWWAKGFKPVVLGRPEATNNPLYRSMQTLKLDPEIETDLLRWLAWGNMGTGILSNWLVYPMCDYDDSMLQFLRTGEFPYLTRYKNMETAFVVGSKKDINAAVQAALDRKQLPEGRTLVDILPKAVFKVESATNAIAWYSADALKSKYKQIFDKLYSKTHSDQVGGKVSLRQLIESHLHSTWQSIFPEGIAVLRSLPEAMTAATRPALDLAGNLTTCLKTPLPASCPPNLSKCRTCMTSQSMPIDTPKVFRNSSTIFSIGTVPHPYTTQALIKRQIVSSLKFLRRNTDRDSFILALTAEALGTGRSSFARIVYMKDAIASEAGKAHSLWLTAERNFDDRWRQDLSWQLGFPVATSPPDTGKSETPVPGPERRPQPKKPKFIPAKMPDEKGVAKEEKLVQRSREWLRKKQTKEERKMRQAVEAWNMADKELWSFTRAFAAQRRMEREKWEEEERKFAGAGGEGRGSWGRWFGKGDEDL
ncbi:Plasma membrane fusion protein prm1 [Sphaceloma murrayae]|uniref:Plasma membrane fusion protein prm1 n=1 Tax=Sphaceloma murrayae TaxID=2082308 RepID=A0A2K1QPD4_9PEZI|nr:Plasma membrane fusion protein prm1 [Sphaceloma murrayae]